MSDVRGTAPSPPESPPAFGVSFPAVEGLPHDEPFKFAMVGGRLHIAASVDLAGLRKLKKALDIQEQLLELMATPWEDTEARRGEDEEDRDDD